MASDSAGANGIEVPKEPVTPPPPPGENKILRVRNWTPQQLNLVFQQDKTAAQTVTFAPLAERDLTVETSREESAFKELENQGLVTQRELSKAEKTNVEGIINGLIGLGVIFFFAASIITSERPEWRLWAWVVAPVVLVALAIIVILGIGLGWTTIQRVFQQVLTLLLVLLTGSALTAATIYYFGGGQDLLGQRPSLALLGRILQFAFIAVASLYPALLYFLFDRSRLSTLRAHFEQQIFRFDPTVHTLSDVYAKYGSRLEELYGRDPQTAHGRYVPGTRWPIWLCTLVITLGWIFTLLPVGVGPATGAAGDVLRYLLPVSSALAYGFLGSYYFAVSSVSRRYTRGDLQPKAYSHIVARVLIVVILAWVVETMLGAGPTLYALMFLIGVIPETFWTVLNEFLRNQVFGRFIHALEEKDPLTNLEGIDPYDRARLSEEGVTNVESLAHHDMIDLILATRIPVARLVDWLDQAILYLHVPSDWVPPEPAPRPEPNGQKPQAAPARGGVRPMTARQRLQTCSIRTATDYLQACQAATERSELAAFASLISGLDDAAEAALRARILYDTLKDDEWLSNIDHWRRTTTVDVRTYCFDPAGRQLVEEPAGDCPPIASQPAAAPVPAAASPG